MNSTLPTAQLSREMTIQSLLALLMVPASVFAVEVVGFISLRVILIHI